MESEQIESQVKEFVSDNDKKFQILKRIIEYEENNEESTFSSREEVDMTTWTPGNDVAMPPSYIGMIKSAPFVNVILDSSNNTILCLSDHQAVKDAVKAVDEEPDMWSDEWIDNRIGGNKIDENLKDIDISGEDKKEIYDTTEDIDALDYWSHFIAPSLKNRDQAKKAILIILASPTDKHGTKGRVNMLAYGPPGTGKSAIKNYLVDKFDVESIDGPRVSKADITYNKSTGKFGQLPKAHKGILVVEESDEMDEGPLGASLTSLGESGKIEIRDKEIPAEVRGIFLSNFDNVDEAIYQWSEESINRFDFLIHFDRLDDSKKDETIDWHYEYFRKPKPDTNEDMFLKYIKLCRQFEPQIDQIDEIQKYKSQNIKQIENVREGISIMNIAWTIARLNFSDVKLGHYKKAFKLMSN